MLPTRRTLVRLAQRPYRCQQRAYADSKPPDPTNTDRVPNDKPVTDPIGVCLIPNALSEHFARCLLDPPGW